jgi:hypothetical protein
MELDISNSKNNYPEGLEFLCEVGISFTENFRQVCYTKQLSHIIDNINKYLKPLLEDELSQIREKLQLLIYNDEIFESWLQVSQQLNYSFIRILLQSPYLQESVLDGIINFLEVRQTHSPSESYKQILQNLIHDLKYLPEIVNPDDFAHFIVSCLNLIDTKYLSLFLYNLDQIITPNEIIIHGLNDFINLHPEFSNNILSLFATFELSPDLKKQIRETVMKENLGQASSPQNLSQIVEFLVSTTDEHNCQSTVENFRKYLIIQPSSVGDTFDRDCMNIFILQSLKQSLKHNRTLVNCFLSTIKEAGSLLTIDLWVIYSLYSLPKDKTNIENLLKKLSDNFVNEDIIKNSISGHQSALETIFSQIIDLTNFALNSGLLSIMKIGKCLSISLFEEVESKIVQQDILALLLQQIGIGNDKNQSFAADILYEICDTYPEKVKFHYHILEHLLFSCENYSLSVFKISANSIVRIVFQSLDDYEAGDQLFVFMQKALSSSKSLKIYGIYLAVSILERLSKLENGQELLFNKFNAILSHLQDNDEMLVEFFYLIDQIQMKSDSFCHLIHDKILLDLKLITSQSKHDDSEKYGNGKFDECIDFEKIVSLKSHLHSIHFQGNPLPNKLKFLMIQGFRTFLNCLKEDCDILFYPQRLYGANSHLTRQQHISLDFLARNWHFEILCYMAKQENNNWKTKMDLIIELEESICSKLKLESAFTDIIFGNIFENHSIFIKKLQNLEETTSFIQKFRHAFPCPTMEVCKLLLQIGKEEIQSQEKYIKRLLYYYLSLFKPLSKKQSSYFKFHFFTEPNLQIIECLSKNFLPDLINNHNFYIAQLILEILINQLSLPIHSSQDALLGFINKISDHQEKCFSSFYKYWSSEQPQQFQLNMLNFLSKLLSSLYPKQTTSIKKKRSKLADISLSMLQDSDSHLSKKDIKNVVNIFLKIVPTLLIKFLI